MSCIPLLVFAAQSQERFANQKVGTVLQAPHEKAMLLGEGRWMLKRLMRRKFLPFGRDETMTMTRSDKTDVIIVVVIATGACLVWWFLVR
jgi:hypothetical protein